MYDVVESAQQPTPDFPVQRISVEHYHRMIKAAVFDENDRLELIRGWLVPKMTHNPLHDATIQRVMKQLQRLLPEAWDLRIQSAITLSDSEPEPDLAVVLGDELRYQNHHPSPTDVGLVIEVADSTLAFDRKVKAETYADAAIPEYWIVNVRDRWIEVLTQPSQETSPANYQDRAILRPGDKLSLRLAGQAVAELAVTDCFLPQ